MALSIRKWNKKSFMFVHTKKSSWNISLIHHHVSCLFSKSLQLIFFNSYNSYKINFYLNAWTHFNVDTMFHLLKLLSNIILYLLKKSKAVPNNVGNNVAQKLSQKSELRKVTCLVKLHCFKFSREMDKIM